MSRAIANKGLAALCMTHELSISGIACYARCKRQSIHAYLKGRHSPRLERRMAELFQVTVPQLRKKLGLPKSEGGVK